MVILLSLHLVACVTSTSKSPNPFPTIVVGKDTTGLYYANSTFGNPGQQQMLRIDIAQPYTWVFSGSDYTECNHLGSGCLTGSLYYIKESTTSELLNDGRVYEMYFIDSIFFNGTAVMDTVNFTTVDNSLGNEDLLSGLINTTVNWSTTTNSLSVKNMSFFNADDSRYVYQGALGLSGKINEANDDIDASNFDGSFYFLDQLVSNGVINSSSYSLWLGGDNENTINSTTDLSLDECGKLILGGVDQSLYTGDFVKFDTLPFYDVESQESSQGYPIIPLTKLSVQSSTGQTLNLTSDSFVEPVLLDSRYTYNYLPMELVIQIAIQANAYYVESLDGWFVSCDIADMGAYMIFEFGNLEIEVPFIDLVSPAYTLNSNSSLHFSNGEEACHLKVFPNSATGFSVLGGPFIKNIFLAADLDSNQIALAQASRVPLSSTSALITQATSSSSSETDTSSTNTETLLIVTDSDSPNNKKRNQKVETSHTNSDSLMYNPSAIRSGQIPFATTNNLTSYESLSLYVSISNSYSASKLVNQFTATISSDGVIFTGRSFYSTSIPKSSSTTAQSSNSSTNAAHGHLMAPISVNIKDYSFIKLISSGLFLLLGITIML